MFTNRQPKMSQPMTMTRVECSSPTTYASTPPTFVSLPLGVPLCSAPVTHSVQDILARLVRG